MTYACRMTTFLVLGLGAAVAAQSDHSRGQPVAPMLHARHTFTLTALPDGTLLAAGGGAGGRWLVACEIFDDRTRTWRSTNDLIEPRHGHTATRLQDGRVLVTGSWTGAYSAASEIYDASTGRWQSAASMNHPRDRHSATLLSDGRVVVAGGFSDRGALSSVEVYDPASDRWTAWPDLPRPTAYHTATSLSAETILLAGGEAGHQNYPYAMLLHLRSQVFEEVSRLSVPRAYGVTATVLRDGSVLLTGGEPNEPGQRALMGTERYDPDSRTWLVCGNLSTPRYFHTATVLDDGRVWVAGGMARGEPGSPQATTEIFDPNSNAWTVGPRMSVGRARHCAAALPGNVVMVVGGHAANGSAMNSVEILEL